MSEYLLALKLMHVLGATVLFGTGLGIAFFMLMAHRTRDPAAIAHTAGIVVIADALFMATAVVIQPVTGWGMAAMIGYSLWHFWIMATLVLYSSSACAGCRWCGSRREMRDLRGGGRARRHRAAGALRHLLRVWFVLGWPAFIGVVAIFVLMIWKPQW